MKPQVHCSMPGLFPLRYWTQVPVSSVQACLRQLFAEWGLPERLRVDNGAPWGSWNDLPPALALWWMGLGIDLIWNHPHHPQENGFVERANGLLDAWGEPASCPSFTVWSERLAWLVQTQREEYPAREGQSRGVAYRALYTNARRYACEQEAKIWDLEKVQAYLGQGRWVRQVSSVGQITLYGHTYGVGRAYAKSQVWVRYDRASAVWVVQDEQGQEVARHAASQITADCICRLEVYERKGAAQRDTNAPSKG
jgi:hypothetical protein